MHVAADEARRLDYPELDLRSSPCRTRHSSAPSVHCSGRRAPSATACCSSTARSRAYSPERPEAVGVRRRAGRHPGSGTRRLELRSARRLPRAVPGGPAGLVRRRARVREPEHLGRAPRRTSSDRKDLEGRRAGSWSISTRARSSAGPCRSPVRCLDLEPIEAEGMSAAAIECGDRRASGRGVRGGVDEQDRAAARLRTSPGTSRASSTTPPFARYKTAALHFTWISGGPRSAGPSGWARPAAGRRCPSWCAHTSSSGRCPPSSTARRSCGSARS